MHAKVCADKAEKATVASYSGTKARGMPSARAALFVLVSGRRLIEALLGVAQARGCYKVILDCSEANQAFYEKCGLTRKEVQMVRRTTYRPHTARARSLVFSHAMLCCHQPLAQWVGVSTISRGHPTSALTGQKLRGWGSTLFTTAATATVLRCHACR
jgi:hypothetical protein